MNYRVDGEKIQFHPERVVQWKKAKTWEEAKNVYPIYVEISPVGACNHRCTFCAVDYIGYKSNMLDAGLLGNRLLEMGSLGVKSVMFAGEGEPLLHKDINEMVTAADVAGIDVSFTTNGVLLDKLDLTGVSWVKVSLNAGTKKTYAKVHRTKEKDFDTVWTNIYEAAKRKGNCDLGVQMLLLPENVHEVQELYDRCNDLGVDYLVVKPYSQHKKSLTHEYEGQKPPEPSVIERGCKFIFRKETYETQTIPYKKCRATPNFWAYIMATGDVYSCSAYLLDDRFNLGNINLHSFSDIWTGPARQKNWNFVRESLDIHECRVNCRMDKVNRYLDELVVGPHGVNFI